MNCEFGYSGAIGALHHSFEPGKLYGISGPNGVGKSTLLQTLAGELEVISGSVLIDGQDPASTGVGKIIRVGDPVFIPDLSIGEHLALLAENYHVEVAQSWQLADLELLLPSRVSSGQRQRVFLATQLQQTPMAFVIDEPERHLDTDWVDFVCEQLIRIARTGAIVVVASHSQQVLSTCDEVIEL